MNQLGNKDTFCLMPWIHLYISQNGKINACCNAPIQYGNAHNDSLKEAFQSDSVNQFKSNLLDGIKDNRCKLCYEQEASGKSSIRTETLDKYKQYWKFDKNKESYSISSPPEFPVYFDIRFSNICNLKCRTCWHGNSSSWFEDAKKMGNAIGSKAILKATNKNMQLIDELVANSSYIEEIYFAGGEPLMMEEHYYFLDQLIEQKSQPLLRYNTNLSNLKLKDKSVLNYWKQFENVELLVSIDQLHEKFEYVRKNAKWKATIENIKRIQELKHIKLEIAPTVSIFNILDLVELHSFFAKELNLGWNSIYFNLLQRPDFYSIQSLSPILKLKATHLIEQHILSIKEVANQRVIDELESIGQFMNAKQLDRKKGFEKYNDKLDAIRNEEFKQLYPEFNVL